MLARIYSGTVVGLDGINVEVEVDIVKKGFPGFTIVGLPGKAVEEAKERVKSALINSSVDFPQYRITVNLAPADVPKPGPVFDLPIAIGVLVASGQIHSHPLIEKSFFIGELSLDGGLRRVKGVLPLVISARDLGFENVFIPQENFEEASIVENINIVPLEKITDFIELVTGIRTFDSLSTESQNSQPANPINKLKNLVDMQEVYGQEKAKRALEIAAAGGHNVFMYGPPGSGKTLLARGLSGILPTMQKEEVVDVSKIYSVAGMLDPSNPLMNQRPFRSPHHTTSRAGLIGGGKQLDPGEISLAHHGVLFLDEFPEFPRSVIESLRQPVEDGVVNLRRVSGAVQYPSRFMLVATSNPCPCGFYGSGDRTCTCTQYQISQYKKKLSGPIMDRIDIHIEVPRVEVDKIISGVNNSKAESTEEIRKRVQAARKIQLERYIGSETRNNACMNNTELKKFCSLGNQEQKMIELAIEKFSLSVRSIHKVIKVARTIADVSGAAIIESEHIAEALQYRPSLVYADVH